MYIWEKKAWPALTWDDESLSRLLARVSHKQGRLLGKMEGLGFDLRTEANLQTLTEDVVKSSEIEGERLNSDQVRSSIARRLGMDVGGLVPADRDVEGVVEMMLDATVNHAAPLTSERLFNWHAALFPTGRSGMRKIIAGAWRDDHDGPMQVVSGPVGKETVHYEAPPAERIPEEMEQFLDWFAQPGKIDPLLRAGLAHLWFVTIHPFDDGNGTGQRFYSMSAQIRRERNEYYALLERTQKGDLDITKWQDWFLNCLRRACGGAEDTLGAVLEKARFWQRYAAESLNERQIKVLNRLLDGFEGKLTSSKWAKIAKCSQDTAYRDILDLVERGALQKDPGGGRSTSYSLTDGEDKN